MPALYRCLCPEDDHTDLNYLDIKQRQIDKRDKIVRILYEEHNISGWFSSLEDKVDLEVCLFDKQANENQLQLIDTVHKKDKKYIKDSLAEINIFPTDTFYEKTAQELVRANLQSPRSKLSYDQYERMINASIIEDVKNGTDKLEAEHYYMTMRTRLKI